MEGYTTHKKLYGPYNPTIKPIEKNGHWVAFHEGINGPSTSSRSIDPVVKEKVSRVASGVFTEVFYDPSNSLRFVTPSVKTFVAQT